MPVIRETRKIFSQPIGVRSFDTGAEQVGRAISNFANRTGQEFYEQAQVNAEKFGAEAAQSVSSEDLKVFDPKTGKPEVLSSMEGMGSIASSAFEQVIERRFVDSVDKDIRLKSAELASKYEDPVQYESMFESYLGSMAKGADDRFKNVIVDSGSYIMGSTKIQLADAARAKSRAAAAASVTATNNEYGETVFDTAASGQREASVVMIEERITASQEAVRAGLYKSGYADTVRSQLGAQAMSGALQVAMKNSTQLQQASMQAYIGSQGLSGGEGMTAEQKSALEPFIGYVDRDNTRAILSEATIISSNLNSITAAKAAERAATYKQSTLSFGMNYSMTDIMPNRAGAAVNSANAWASQDQASIIGSIDAANTAYRSNLSDIRDARLRGLGVEETNAFIKDARRAGLDAAIIGMASDGNIEALKVALVTGNPNDVARLSTLQQAALSALQGSMLYDPAEDRNYVGTLLSGTQNQVQDRIDREIRNANLFIQVGNESTRFLNGVFDLTAIEESEKLASSALKDGDISANEFESLSNGLRASAGKGIANIVSGNMSSIEMNALANYVASGGEETAGVSPFVVSTGDAIIGTVSEDGRPTVVNHINSLREKLSRKEALAEKQNEKLRLQSTLNKNKGSVLNKTHRVAQGERLVASGFVLTDPSTYATPERREALFEALRATPSQELIDGLTRISLGLETPGADALLDVFSILSNDATSLGIFVNRFGIGEGAPISPTKTALLQDIASIRKIEGGSAGDIARALVERTNDPKSDIAASKIFKKLSPREYVADKYGDIIAEDLTAVADYLARTGSSEEDVAQRLEELVDTYYAKSTNVIDPRFPVNSQNRTAYSLEKMFPNEDRRNAFIDIIASQLPEGFRLNGTRGLQAQAIKVPSNIAMQGSFNQAELAPGVTLSLSDGAKEKRVYLVPNESTTGVAYYAYYIDENYDLLPLIQGVGEEMTWPMWDESELDDYDEQAAIDSDIEIESQLDTRERVLKAVRKRPGLRSFSEIKNLSFGDGS